MIYDAIGIAFQVVDGGSTEEIRIFPPGTAKSVWYGISIRIPNHPSTIQPEVSRSGTPGRVRPELRSEYYRIA
jgi:hypothetical protein